MSDVRTIKNLPYATYGSVSLPLDLYLPLGAPRPLPVVLWLPGGGWFECNKETAPSFYARHGFAIAAINYRVSPQDCAPANVHDCKAAVRWLRAHALEYGLDAANIGVWGKSAGGHLALLLGLTPDLPELEGDGGNAGFSSRVQAVCSFYGVSDLARLIRDETRGDFPAIHEASLRYLGRRPEACRDLVRLLSPIAHVSEDAPPTLLFHGDADPVVPLEQSVILHEALKQAGADVELHVVEGAGHHWNLDLTQDRWVGFFRRTLSRRTYG